MANITLALDDKLLKAARGFAKKQGTTLNALVREQLSSAIARQEKQELARRQLIELMDSSTARMGPDFKWNREELYESRMLSGHKHPGVRRGRKAG